MNDELERIIEEFCANKSLEYQKVDSSIPLVDVQKIWTAKDDLMWLEVEIRRSASTSAMGKLIKINAKFITGLNGDFKAERVHGLRRIQRLLKLDSSSVKVDGQIPDLVELNCFISEVLQNRSYRSTEFRVTLKKSKIEVVFCSNYLDGLNDLVRKVVALIQSTGTF